MIATALAAWRLASLLVEEDGPGALFARLRYRAGVRYAPMRRDADQITAERVALTPLAEGLTCVWCVSVWTAGLFWLGRRWSVIRELRAILAISSGAILVHELLQRWRGE